MLPHRSRRRPATKRTDYLIERVRQLSAKSLLQGEIAMQLGVCHATVGRWQRHYGIAHPDRTEGRAAAMARRLGSREAQA